VVDNESHLSFSEGRMTSVFLRYAVGVHFRSQLIQSIVLVWLSPASRRGLGWLAMTLIEGGCVQAVCKILARPENSSQIITKNRVSQDIREGCMLCEHTSVCKASRRR
jgi:hypothetical protein